VTILEDAVDAFGKETTKTTIPRDDAAVEGDSPNAEQPDGLVLHLAEIAQKEGDAGLIASVFANLACFCASLRRVLYQVYATMGCYLDVIAD
jgi:hypothetical protein